MTATVSGIVQPASSRLEGISLLVATICVGGLLAAYVVLFGRETETQRLLEWQISSFATLEGADQAIYNSLFTVKDEIPYIYDSINRFNEPGTAFRWPDIQDFQDWLLPPFYQDTSWEQTGSLQWSLFEPLAEGEMQGSIMYLGTDGSLPEQGSFLLIIGHVHAGITNNNSMQVWYHNSRSIDMPNTGFQDTLILEDWKLVIPYSGAEEVDRIYGE